MEKVKNFIKEHKKEIVIATVAGAAGVLGGAIFHKEYVSKKYGDLIKVIGNFGADCDGVTMLDDTVAFFNGATYSVEVMRPNNVQTIKQTFGDGGASQILVERGFSPNTVLTGVLVGIKAAEPNG